MKVWRREHIDWTDIEQDLTLQLRCHRCGKTKYKDCYSQTQWDKPGNQGNCKTCVKQREEENTPLDCVKRGQWEGLEAFAPHQRTAHSAKNRVGLDGVKKRQCIQCKLYRSCSAFTPKAWGHAANKDKQGRCKDCMIRSEKTRGDAEALKQRCTNHVSSDGVLPILL